jgi:Rrf2 family iron-sulfur cluster assembly transcriptional regulator
LTKLLGYRKILSAILLLFSELFIMRLTTRGRYAVTAMVDLALHVEKKPVSLAEIAERQGLSQSYLEQLFSKLRKGGLVDGRRGPGGGYTLGKPINKISVGDVITAVNETVDATLCGGHENCHGETRCLTHNLWQELSCQIRKFLREVSLEQLANDAKTNAELKKSPDVNSKASIKPIKFLAESL